MKALKIRFDTLPMAEREKYNRLVQEKAFDLGYVWPYTSKRVITIFERGFNWLYFYKYRGSKCVTSSQEEIMETSNHEIAQEIAIDDFLALPEEEHEFQPFEQVLVRDSENDTWGIDLFSHKGDALYSYSCVGSRYNYCIPYKGNEHLLGGL